jgi:hypothetical protein
MRKYQVPAPSRLSSCTFARHSLIQCFLTRLHMHFPSEVCGEAGAGKTQLMMQVGSKYALFSHPDRALVLLFTGSTCFPLDPQE